MSMFGGPRNDAARQAASNLCTRKLGSGNVEVDPDAQVTFLDEPGTEVEGWAYVTVAVLVPIQEIQRATRGGP